MKIFLILIAVAGIGYGAYRFLGPSNEPVAETRPYEFAKLERRSITNLVSATGTVSAREIVEVGTQVSGTITQVLADFNDVVEEGALIAMIDPSVLDTQVKGAKADLLRAEAQLKRARIDHDRFLPVHEKGFLSDNDFLPYEISLQTAKAGVMDAEANLDRAERNRAFAEVRAPISGIVIDRKVEPGQTVAASFNTPRLFIIAEDLGLMEILANVDESDIGQIKVGQDVRYTVAAHPDREFTGRVTEIRLQPEVIQNVVHYTVVVETENPAGSLLPGMTATMDFVVDEVEDVLSIPSSALNLRLSPEMAAVMQARREQFMQRRQQRAEAAGEPAAFRRQQTGGGGVFGGAGPGGLAGAEEGGRPGGGVGRRGVGLLWYQDENDELQMMMVRTGVSDGIHTEVSPVRDNTLEDGMEVISKVLTATVEPAAPSGSGRPSGLRRLGF